MHIRFNSVHTIFGAQICIDYGYGIQKYNFAFNISKQKTKYHPNTDIESTQTLGQLVDIIFFLTISQHFSRFKKA